MMSTENGDIPVNYEFGAFRIDACDRTLTADGQPVKIAPRNIECLVLLVSAKGRIVSKDEFFSTVWHETFVEDNSLSYAISQIRKILAEIDPETTYIQTVPKRGFRLAVDVTETRSLPAVPEREYTLERQRIDEVWIEETDDRDASLTPRHMLPAQPASNRLWFVAAFLILAVIAVSSFAYWKNSNRHRLQTLAVLPLKQIGQNNSDDSLSLRITDSLITKIGRLKQISVRPTASMLRFQADRSGPVEIGRLLEVDAVLDGRFQLEGDNIRVNLQLIDVSTGDQVWSEQFDGRTDRLLDLQDSVSAKLVGHLDLGLTNDQKTAFADKNTSNQEAFEYYLRGRYFWNKRTPDSLRNAITSFQTAIERDPNFADAYVGLADSYFLLVDYSYDTSEQNIDLARANLNKAIQLNPNISEAYTTLGLLQISKEWNWKAAEESMQKALEISDNSPNAHHRYGLLLLKLRRVDEAESQLRQAKKLDPTSPAINTNLGLVLLDSKKYDAAKAQLSKTIELDPSFITPRWYLARCHWLNGDKRASLIEYAAAIGREGDTELAAKILRDIDAMSDTDAMKQLAIEWEKRIGPTGINDHDMAMLNAFLGDADETLKWLDRSVSARHPWATWINVEPEFDFVRDTPRFQELLRKMNFR